MENSTDCIEEHCLEGGMREQAVCGNEVGCEVPGVVGDGEGCMVGDKADVSKGSEGVGGYVSAVVGMEPEDVVIGGADMIELAQ